MSKLHRDLYASLLNHLVLTAAVVDKEGEIINENEEFTVGFTLKNTSPAGFPRIVFKDPELKVMGSEFVEVVPRESEGEIRPFNDRRLVSGEETELLVNLKAKRTTSADHIQQVARGICRAGVDYEQFFLMEAHAEVEVSIHPT